jgi:hypothetical protein
VIWNVYILFNIASSGLKIEFGTKRVMKGDFLFVHQVFIERVRFLSMAATATILIMTTAVAIV